MFPPKRERFAGRLCNHAITRYAQRNAETTDLANTGEAVLRCQLQRATKCLYAPQKLGVHTGNLSPQVDERRTYMRGRSHASHSHSLISIIRMQQLMRCADYPEA